MEIGEEVILLEDIRIHLVGDSRAILIIHRGTTGIVNSPLGYPNENNTIYNILWKLPGFDFIARNNPKWKLEKKNG